MTGSRTIIVGGGLAGLAAAARLGRHRENVLLLESRPRLGGRATSFEDAATGETIDNCQHVGMGCCTALQQFCGEMGLGDLFRVERELTFIDGHGRHSRFAASRLPAPLHLAGAFARLKYLSWRDRLQIARGLKALARDPGPWERPFVEWLDDHGQGPRVQRLFWHVVLVSALSESLDRIETAAAKKVFVDGFLSHRSAYEVHLPTRPLDDLYGRPVIEELSRRGVEVRTNAAVAEVEAEWVDHEWPGEVDAVRLRSGERIEADTVVLAVPWHRVADLLPDWAGIDVRLDAAPIASVHLWLDRAITDLPHAVFVEHLSQWLFARPPAVAAVDDGDGDADHYYQVVISASRGLLSRDRQAVVDEVVGELRDAFPEARAARVRRSRLVIEKRAVFSVTPGSDRHRPPQATQIDGLFLAGDYTRTGWPSTMEGAVRSGELAAAAVLGIDPAIPPDLPRGRLARWFVGSATADGRSAGLH